MSEGEVILSGTIAWNKDNNTVPYDKKLESSNEKLGSSKKSISTVKGFVVEVAVDITSVSSVSDVRRFFPLLR